MYYLFFFLFFFHNQTYYFFFFSNKIVECQPNVFEPMDISAEKSTTRWNSSQSEIHVHLIRQQKLELFQKQIQK
mgnify:CR=1 FL=1